MQNRQPMMVSPAALTGGNEWIPGWIGIIAWWKGSISSLPFREKRHSLIQKDPPLFTGG